MYLWLRWLLRGLRRRLLRQSGQRRRTRFFCHIHSQHVRARRRRTAAAGALRRPPLTLQKITRRYYFAATPYYYDNKEKDPPRAVLIRSFVSE